MTPRTKRRETHYPLLREQSSRVLHWMIGCLADEVAACDRGVVPAMRDAFLACALLCDAELRFRDPRRTTHPLLRPFVHIEAPRVRRAKAKKKGAGR